MTSDDADKLRARALEYIRAASRSGELAAQRERELAYLLYRWRDFAGDDGGEVKHWTDEQLTSDEMVVKFTEAFTSHSWSQGMGFAGLGDTVARRNIRANVSTLQSIMDQDRFRSRVEELAASQNLSKAHVEVISELGKVMMQIRIGSPGHCSSPVGQRLVCANRHLRRRERSSRPSQD